MTLVPEGMVRGGTRILERAGERGKGTRVCSYRKGALPRSLKARGTQFPPQPEYPRNAPKDHSLKHLFMGSRPTG